MWPFGKKGDMRRTATEGAAPRNTTLQPNAAAPMQANNAASVASASASGDGAASGGERVVRFAPGIKPQKKKDDEVNLMSVQEIKDTEDPRCFLGGQLARLTDEDIKTLYKNFQEVVDIDTIIDAARRERAREEEAARRAEAEGSLKRFKDTDQREGNLKGKFGEVLKELGGRFPAIRGVDLANKPVGSKHTCTSTTAMPAIIINDIKDLEKISDKALNTVLNAGEEVGAETGTNTTRASKNAKASKSGRSSKSPKAAARKKKEDPNAAFNKAFDKAFAEEMKKFEERAKKEEISSSSGAGAKQEEGSSSSSAGAAASTGASSSTGAHKTATRIWFLCRFAKFLLGDEKVQNRIDEIIKALKDVELTVPIQFGRIASENNQVGEIEKVWIAITTVLKEACQIDLRREKESRGDHIPGNLNPADARVGLFIGEIFFAIIIEYKMFGKFPYTQALSKTNGLSAEDFNFWVNQPNVKTYMESPAYRPDTCTIRQIRGYCLTQALKYGMITTIEDTVFTYIDEEKADEHHPIYLTDRFKGNNGYPFANMPCSCNGNNKDCQQLLELAKGWSLWEILLRFLLVVALGGEDSNKLSKVPRFLLKYFEGKGKPSNKDEDEEGGDENEEENEEGGNGGFGAASSKKTNASGKNEPVDFESPSWADLFAPCRFVEGANYMFGHVEGDAEELGENRTGVVYRQNLQGWDAVIKTLILSRPREVDGKLVDQFKIRNELLREKKVYSKLKHLQGSIIPIFLWHGELVVGMVDALVTEYAGSTLPESLNKIQIENAKAAMNAIHEAGVLHGDIALRNLLLKKGTKDEIVVIDFAFSKFRKEYEHEALWNWEVAKEQKELDMLLNDCYNEETESMPESGNVEAEIEESTTLLEPPKDIAVVEEKERVEKGMRKRQFEQTLNGDEEAFC